MTSGSNLNDFPENQLIIDFAFLCKRTWGNATVSPFPVVLISFGERRSPKNIWGNGVPRLLPRLYTVHHWTKIEASLFRDPCKNQGRELFQELPSITLRISGWSCAPAGPTYAVYTVFVINR